MTMRNREADRLQGWCDAVRYVVRGGIAGDIVGCGDPPGDWLMAAASVLDEMGDRHRVIRLDDPSEPPPLSSIALLRIALEDYGPTRAVLERLIPRVTAGGILVMDDSENNEGAQRAVDECFDELDRPLFVNWI